MQQDSQKPQNATPVFLLLFVGFIIGVCVGFMTKDLMVRAMIKVVPPMQVASEGEPMGDLSLPIVTDPATSEAPQVEPVATGEGTPEEEKKPEEPVVPAAAPEVTLTEPELAPAEPVPAEPAPAAPVEAAPETAPAAEEPAPAAPVEPATTAPTETAPETAPTEPVPAVPAEPAPTTPAEAAPAVIPPQ